VTEVAVTISAVLAFIGWLIATLSAGASGDLGQVVINLLLSSFQMMLDTLVLMIVVWPLVAIATLGGMAVKKAGLLG